MHQLVAQCAPLDTNSVYCNLLQASHFGATSVGAWRDGTTGPQLVGSITAYRLPAKPDTLFVWQVAVHPSARGLGLGKQLIEQLLLAQPLGSVHHLQTTITLGNKASWALFTGFAQRIQAPTSSGVLFDQQAHFGNQAPSEHLLAIGPIDARMLASSQQGNAEDAHAHARTRAMPTTPPG